MLRTVVLSGLASFVIAADCLRFEQPRSGGGRPFALAVLAIAPALLRPWWLRLTGAAVSVFFGLCLAFSVSPLHIGDVGPRFGRGFLDFYDFRIPIDPAQHVRMHQVLLVAIFGFTLAVALALGSRRALPAVIAFLIGAGWPATLLAGGNEIGRGVVILAVALALLAGLTQRPSRLALGAAAIVIVGAFALSSSAAVAKTAFLDWQHWDFYTHPEKPVSVRYGWDANYGGVHFPKNETTVLSIRAPSRPQYWRATVLDQFDGTRWREHVWGETPAEAHLLTPPGADGRESRMFRLLTGPLEPYAELYTRARNVAGETDSPYAAAVALERWFRVTGGFTYSEQPGRTPGLPPLVGFVVDTRSGYCQHFAGAMALMLRLLGIPARVAAGFVPGHYSDGTWTVTDHDAHTWVEVWFRGYGWLAFDPTPGRGRLSGSPTPTSSGVKPAAAG